MKYQKEFDKNGNILSEQTVKDGESAVAPAAPEVRGYTFIGWNKTYSAVFNDLIVTAQYKRIVVPVVITVYADRSFSFITKTPPAPVLIKKACNIKSGSGVPNKTKVAKITKEQIKKIAETKMPDLNAASMEAAMSMIAGTARSMGVEVVD